MLLLPRDNGLEIEKLQGPHEFLATKRVLFLHGPMFGFPMRADHYNPSSLADTMLALDIISHDPIWLVIHSPGGSVDDGFMLVDAMEAVMSPVYTVTRSASSMATIVMAVGEPGHRYIYPNAQIMLHLLTGGAMGDPRDAQIHADQMAATQDGLIELLLKHGATKSKRVLKKDIERDFWMNGQEAVDYGLADFIYVSGTLPTYNPSDEITA